MSSRAARAGMPLGDAMAVVRARHREFPRAEFVYHEGDPLSRDLVLNLPGLRLRFDAHTQLLAVCGCLVGSAGGLGGCF